MLAAFLPFLARGAFLARAAYLLVLTLHTRLVINPNALCRLACASLWKPCAKHGHGGLQLRSGCARNAVCRNVSYSAVDALGCCQLVARSWESWVHWACLLMLQQIWWRGLQVGVLWLAVCMCFVVFPGSHVHKTSRLAMFLQASCAKSNVLHMFSVSHMCKRLVLLRRRLRFANFPASHMRETSISQELLQATCTKHFVLQGLLRATCVRHRVSWRFLRHTLSKHRFLRRPVRVAFTKHHVSRCSLQAEITNHGAFRWSAWVCLGTGGLKASS